jgi:hypothetical protein
MVVINKTINPKRNKISASLSIFVARAVVLRMARKDNKQLLIKMIIAKAAPSSIKDDSSSFEILTDVKTMKQNPNKLAEVFKICGDLFSFSTFILFGVF